MRRWAIGPLLVSVTLVWPLAAHAGPEAEPTTPSVGRPTESPTSEPDPTPPTDPDEPSSETAPDESTAAGEEPEAAPAPEPEPQPQPEPEAAPQPTSVAVAVEPVADEARPVDRPKDRRTLGIGLLAAGSGFVAIGTATAVLYGVGDGKCGGSCVGGAIVAATGVAGVVVGALLVTRHPKATTAHRRGRAVARWRPGMGLQF